MFNFNVDSFVQDASFYPFLRLFVPNKDPERGTFGIQIRTLGGLFVKALAVNPKSDTAQKLKNLEGSTADYGDIVHEVTSVFPHNFYLVEIFFYRNFVLTQ